MADTKTPSFGRYIVIEVSTPKSREQEKVLALNCKLNQLHKSRNEECTK